MEHHINIEQRERLLAWLEDPQVYDDLRRVRELGLPQACIAAGYVRNRVWDKLHGYVSLTPLNDIDVIYFDPEQQSDERDEWLEQQLGRDQIHRNWSVKNQAHMHIRNGHAPYASVTDAMRYWPETATAVGIYLDQEDQLQIVAPFGLQDLMDLKVRKGPYFRSDTYFRQRVFDKQWLDTWPLLIVEA
ncbi:nucleotidyltransferase family protein [Paenibacillus massiliensis]|uniref:nucleotidyltransferase family protein n=1 Tax=Paenibacillus massiliensis TaxID=225917 RepID=UPI000405F5C0|nr:nucleotidyltransferase family protein [Paenibacillus massiliensis]